MCVKINNGNTTTEPIGPAILYCTRALIPLGTTHSIFCPARLQSGCHSPTCHPATGSVMDSPKVLVASVFILACCGTTTWVTMRSLSQGSDISRLAASIDATKVSMREQLELASAARRSLEEQVKDIRDSSKEFKKVVQELRDANSKRYDALKADLGSLKDDLQGEVKKVLESGTEKVQALESTVQADALKSAELNERVSSVLDSISTQADTIADVTTRTNDTSTVVQALVEQVVSIKREFNMHTSTPHLALQSASTQRQEQVTSATSALASAAVITSLSPPPPPIAVPSMSPPVAAHADGKAAAAAEARYAFNLRLDLIVNECGELTTHGVCAQSC